MINQRLDENCIADVQKICKEKGFLLPGGFDLRQYCSGRHPTEPCVQMYGIYEYEKLISIMTATFCYVFPHSDSPNGKIVHISGAYTLPKYRNMGYASRLIEAIRIDATMFFGADYICCDTTVPNLFQENGFEISPINETRMWRPL